MATYKSPGVFVEEIATLPPSVAQVETAIPVFIGYTEFAERDGEQVFNKPVPVDSLKNYEEYFGAGPATDYETYLDSATNKVTQVVQTVNFLMYDSLRLFFNNGGGKCYIVAVDSYANAGSVTITDLTNALAAVEKQDEPTIIVSPDAVLSSSSTDLHDFQKAALSQCAKLGDRVLLCDIYPHDETDSSFDSSVQDFRDKIGINHLKYGAAYAPYLRSSLSKNVKYRQIDLRQGNPSSFSSIHLLSLSSDSQIRQMIHDLSESVLAVDAFANIQTTSGVLSGSQETFADAFRDAFSGFDTAPAIGTLKSIYDLGLEILTGLNSVKNTELPAPVSTAPAPPSSTTSKDFRLQEELENIASIAGADQAFLTLATHANYIDGTMGGGDTSLMDPSDPNYQAAVGLLGITDPMPPTDAAVESDYNSAATDADRWNLARNVIASQYPVIIKYFNAVLSAAKSYESTFEQSLENAFGLYKQIKQGISLQTSALPPSGAIAGVYAQVDNARGVWKAPANVSLNSVLGPVIQLSSEDQESLNVDSVAGKSINAIRVFTGKGTLVWGARTLAGNDNEWRYISVRRFFNMVEESSKKSTEPFVFENNDANTWVRVKGMLDNYLTNLWRQGALQGAKPEHAFYVSVGLGKTMTSVDILEGRMIVEIGMAVVRPAEFIILRFSHKLAES